MKTIGELQMVGGRCISQEFRDDLKWGILKLLLQRVKDDHTLMLAIRKNYINIYYRGGSLFKVSADAHAHAYNLDFDKNYYIDPKSYQIEFPLRISDASETAKLIAAVPGLKDVMDRYFSMRPKPEREFQQLVVRENNFSQIANATDYFIVDIELADRSRGARYDMLAVRWLRTQRTRKKALVPALIEMKYGIDAIDGKSGILEHLRDAESLRGSESWGHLIAGMEEQINQLDELGLLSFNRSEAIGRLEIDTEKQPELIFLLSNYNPASTIMATLIKEFEKLAAEPQSLDVLFSVSCFAGYAMRRVSMLTPTEFAIEVRRLHELGKSKPV